MLGMLTFLRLRVESEMGKTMQNGATAGICENYQNIQFMQNLKITIRYNNINEQAEYCLFWRSYFCRPRS
jgi:hypothetical protein